MAIALVQYFILKVFIKRNVSKTNITKVQRFGQEDEMSEKGKKKSTVS